MELRGNWNYPTAIRFGAGRIKELAGLCAELNIKKPLLVTDRGLAQMPMTVDILKLLNDAGLQAALFSDLRPNPIGRDVDAGVAAYQAGGHDGVISLGGGSALDVGKAIAQGHWLLLQGIDGYRAQLPIAQAIRWRMLLASRMDDQALAMGGVGPLWAIFAPETIDDLKQLPIKERFQNAVWGLYYMQVSAQQK